jgi:hypothetical protein
MKMTGTTRAIETLLEIMRDANVPARRRIEAAEALLGFEAPPETVRHAREYLVAVFEDREQEIADRMDALKLARKFESPKISLPTIHTKKQETDRREAWRAYEIAERELKIIVATKDTPPPGWDDDLRADSYVPPAEGWPGEPPEIPLRDLVAARRTRQDRMEAESKAAMEREAKAVEAQSRDRLKARRNGSGNLSDEPSEG